MLNIRVASIFIYLIFALIMVQSTLAFILNAIEPSLDSSKVYVVKDLVIVSFVLLMLLTKARYEICSLDKYVITLILLVPVLLTLYSANAWEFISAVRFYTMPLVMYLLGRYVIHLKDDRVFEKFILFVSIAFVVISLAYVFIDRDILLALNITDFFQDKYKIFGRSDAMINGFPINFYFHRSDGSMMERSFGALFDPLATAFFGATILFFCYELYRRKKKVVYFFLAWLILLVIGLSFTRAILLMIPVVLLMYGIKKYFVRITPILPIIVFMMFFIVVMTQNLENLRSVLDPSTIAHLSVYEFDQIISLATGQVRDSEIRGSESLYLTMIKENGLLFFGLYLLLFVKIYRYLISNKDQVFSYALLTSFVVYVMASFTTEHWFALSSSSLFWFLLGRNVKTSKGVSKESAKNTQIRSCDNGKGRVVRASMY